MGSYPYLVSPVGWEIQISRRGGLMFLVLGADGVCQVKMELGTKHVHTCSHGDRGGLSRLAGYTMALGVYV